MDNKLRVWWIPQVSLSCDTFYIPVQSVEEGKKNDGFISSIRYVPTAK